MTATPPRVTTELRYATHYVRRPVVTRDLPYGPEDLRWVTNTVTLIYGERDAVLVDTFTTIEQNTDLVEWVKSFNRNLTQVYITHGHGDHFFGIKQLVEAFPGEADELTRAEGPAVILSQDLRRGVEALKRSGPGHATFAGR
jgi:glyoxylase-like metal-dependent hydrolase (beta-lactamase superfamily II)